MATVIGDRDVLLLGSSQRALNPLGSKIILGTSAPAFKVDSNGNALPSSITITAALIGIAGTVAFTATGATVTDNHDNTATLAYSSLTGTSCTVTTSINVNGQAFTASVTLSKVTDGATGSNGSTGNQYATVYLYQWATSKPANPNGTTGYTWATGVNSTYTGTDQWQINPTNPGTSGFQLYAAAVQITAPGGTASTVVSYSNATVMTWSQNGNNGTNGANGVQSTTVQVYRWDSSTAPSAPAGTATYIWTGVNAGTFGTAPSGWQINPGVAPSQGMTLWAARVRVTDSATNTSTSFNWTDSAIIAVGGSGSNGAAGASGASYVTAYCASTTGTTTTAPPQTTGKTSLPATNSGGLTGTWSASVPTLSTGQYLYQTDGIYDPTTDKVTWSIPYWSSLKVGNLSAITGNMGRLYITDTISDSANNWSIDSNGHMEAKSWTLRDSSNNVILSAGGQLAVSAAAPGTLNSQQQWVDVSGTGKPADYATVSAADAATALGFNPQFSNWTGTYPAGWNAWGTAPVKETSNYRTGPYAVKYTVSGETGIFAAINFPTPLPAGTFVQGSFDINVITNNGGGSPGYLIRLFTDSSFIGFVDNKVIVPDKTVTGWQHVPFIARVGAGQVIWGMTIYQMASWSGMPGGNWANGSVCIFDNLAFDFYDSSTDNKQQQWTDVGGTGKPADNATVGAPSGTYVGGMEAGLAASYAANGNSAYNAVNDGTNGLAQKLKSNAQNVLSGGAGLSAGTLAWDGSGNRTSGSGVGINRNGIVAYNSSGVATFTLDATNGNATFAGTLASASGTFGAVTVASGGYVASGQTAYNTGTGFFLGYSGSTAVFSLGVANGTGIRWDGTSLTIQNPIIATPFSATITSSSNSYTISHTATNGFGGTYTANPTNGTGPYTYSWSVSTSGISRGWVGGSSTNYQAQLSIESNGRLNGDEQDFYMTCVVTDTSSNVSKTVTYLTTIYFS